MRSRRSRGLIRPSQVGVGEPLSDDTPYGVNEPTNVFGAPVVESVYLLIEVAEQMERFNRNVGALNATLQQAPEVLQPVGVDLPLGVAFGVVNDLMDESLIQLLV